MNTKEDGLNSGRRQLIVILAVSLASLGGAYLLFYLAQGGAVWDTVNHGRFVEPHTTTADLGWPAAQQVETWWLWVNVQRCDAACEDGLQQLRSVHVLLNREAGRVRRAITVGNLQGWPAETDNLERVELQRDPGIAGGVYIIDPLGNLVLHYNMPVEPQGVLDDLKRLLKLSQIG